MARRWPPKHRMQAWLVIALAAGVMIGCGDHPGPDPADPPPDLRDAPVLPPAGSRIIHGPTAVEATLAEALGELVQGPSPEERARGVTSFFSPETAHIVRSVSVEGPLARVDFRDFRALIPNASSSAGSEAFLQDLNETVFGAAPVDEVAYSLEGDCEAFWNFLQRGCHRVHRGNDHAPFRYSPRE